MIKVRSLLQEGTRRLEAAGMTHARHEAEWLLGRLLSARRLELYLHEMDIPAPTVERFVSQIDARAAGMPLQYLLEETDFYGAPVAVAPGVFIPRPETEVIVEAALVALQARVSRLARPLHLLDVGTGSGCIAVTLARCLPACVVVAIELSWDALRIAQHNVQRQGLSSQIHLVHGRWVESIRGRFDGIISNPPYIPSAQVNRLPLDVRQEPRLSLDGGLDGMRALRHLIDEVPRLLRPGGVMTLECAQEQAGVLIEQAQADAWVATAQVIRDLADRPRGLLMTRKNID